MSFRFRKSIKILPGVKVNLNKDSFSLSVGPRGAKVTVNSKGGVRKTAGLPGTGLSVTDYSNIVSSKIADSTQTENAQLIRKGKRKSATIFCSNCGTKLSSRAKFCSNCGAVVEAIEEQQPDNSYVSNSEFITFKCINCGKDLSVDSTWSSATCPFCNTTFVVDQNKVNQYISDNTIYIKAVSVNTFFADDDVEVRRDKMFLINKKNGRVKKEYYFDKMDNIRIEKDCMVFDYKDGWAPVVLIFKDNKTTEICNFIINSKQGVYKH